MGNEKYVNYYVDILSSTLTDAVLRNISLQANHKIADEALQELQKENEHYKNEINRISLEGQKAQAEKLQSVNNEVSSLKNTINQHVNTITNLQSEINTLKTIRSEYDSLKHQLGHIDTFRNQLIQSQRTIEEKDLEIKKLNEKIDYLQLTPAKRKKIDDMNKTVEEQPQVNENSLETIIKDGGSF